MSARTDTNAIFDPSGDHAGLCSPAESLVSFLRSVPSANMTKTWGRESGVAASQSNEPGSTEETSSSNLAVNAISPPSLEPEQARFRLFDSITTFLKNAARSQPILLVLDDLHWADRSSLPLMEFLAKEIGVSRLLVVGCYRDVEISRKHPLSETLAQLARESAGVGFQRHLLRGLNPLRTQEIGLSGYELGQGYRGYHRHTTVLLRAGLIAWVTPSSFSCRPMMELRFT